ncbi:glycine--tRNA ligase subunit beta [Erythrobacter sp. JK5]|uniref:glycine--tRNA ligase subunit beta n=1 Tax=Erythrobacter sp. JK5 TaxID=2829500 RepID=UPI001BA88FA8|nr:glycine--tRNA ligase subunit beta [Erythrobacter sp. JK5]QUL39356.1 glycine--tRNA ligase subunit beta [Erythrobacter sp. JK5]
MADFLLELRSEEIPARMQAGARAELEKLFRREMEAAGVETGEVTVWSTPRRLALIAKGLPTETGAVHEEAKGPPVGAPDQAVDGFCRKNGVTRDQLEERDVKGRATWFAVIEKPGQAVSDLLAAAIPAIIRDFSWPKSMRWGEASISTESLKWVRPLSGIVALLDGEVVPCVMDGLASGRETVGHRFHSTGPIAIDGAGDYADRLRAAHVIVDHEERQDIIRVKVAAEFDAMGLDMIEDEGLVVENAGLTEWPVPLVGGFDEEFLDVPPEVIQLTARLNQKYFMANRAGSLAPVFACVANIEANDGGDAVAAGNEKVLAARLSDARFFWELDQKTPLAEHAQKLERITFHEKLGTVADKVERVAKLARWLCEEGIVKGDPGLAEQAARLCKADLVTEMVGEFPELQGLMGGYYAEKEGLPQEVSDAIRDHYKPVGQGDDVPTAPVTVAVSLADKLDTLAQFFRIDERPTGSKDPFALRRAVIGMISISVENSLRFDFIDAFDRAIGGDSLLETVIAGGHFGSFVLDRLKVQQREAGVRHDVIDAVASLGGDEDLGDEHDLVRLLARVKALQGFIETDNGVNLLAGYKRAANILKKEDYPTPLPTGEGPGVGGATSDASNTHPQPLPSREGAQGDNPLSYSPEPAEKALIDALDAAAPTAAQAIEAEDFEGAMAALATLRVPIDAFFDEVTVNDDDPAKREARLALLARFRDAVHRVADFSRIEG